MTVTIKGKEYAVKNNIMAMMIFEELRKKAFRIETITDQMVYLYSMVVAANQNEFPTWEEFVDAATPKFLAEFGEFLAEEAKKTDIFGDEGKEGSKKNP